MLEVSNNARAIASCWKKYEFNYLQGLSPKKQSIDLSLGGIMHDAFDMSAKGATDSDVLNHIKTTFEGLGRVEELIDQEDITVAMYTAMGMWAHYPYKDLSGFSDYKSELEFKVPLGKKRGVRFVGRVDGLLKEDGHWWVREYKTTGLTPRQFQGRMAKSGQVSGYIYALRKMGYDIKGVMVDMIKKPLLRKRVNDTGETFGQRIMNDYLEDRKVSEGERKAYLRHKEYRSDTQIEHWLRDMEMFVDDVRSRKKSNKWYRNYDNCWRYNKLCHYSLICDMATIDPLTVDMLFDKRAVEVKEEE
jgi:hypothetical protein